MKIKTKMLSAILTAVAVGSVSAATLSLADARAQINDCINDSSKMSRTVKQLSADDQRAFLGEVNDAISKMPGSEESKTAKFLRVNRAAVTSASAGNRTKMFAEVFATVPPESLTVINERFAADLLNRSANPASQVTDAQFKKVSENIMSNVTSRCSGVENGAERAAFAALMLVRASNNTISDLADTLVKQLPTESQDTAKTSWIPEAMKGNYDPILGNVDYKSIPSNDVVLRLAGPQLLDAMLGDIVEDIPAVNNVVHDVDHSVGVLETSLAVEPAEPDEPDGYQGQW